MEKKRRKNKKKFGAATKSDNGFGVVNNIRYG